MPARIERKSGDHNGRLTLVKESEPDRWGGRQFLFKCDCGSEVVARWGITRSCGCLQRETTIHITNYKKRLGCGEACLNFVYNRYLMRARNKCLEFVISKAQFLALTQQACHYCGCPPSNIETKYHDAYGTFTYNGLDRVDPKRGYLLSNVVPCCRICNVAKSIMTKEEFIAWIERVHNHQYACLSV